MATVRQCLARIARHNRSIALQALYSDLADIGAIFEPKITLLDWKDHVMLDSKHLSRWTSPGSPEDPRKVFAKELVSMEKTRLLKEFTDWNFIVDAKSRKGPVWIVGWINDTGELLPMGVYPEGWSAAFRGARERTVNITSIINDPKQWDL